jgi:hypothetical protein
MPYSFRPGHKLKRPARYGDEMDTSPEPGSAAEDHHSPPPSSREPASFTSHLTATALTTSSTVAYNQNPAPMRDVGNSSDRSKMANVKFIKTRKRPVSDAQKEDRDNTPPPRRPAGRPSKATRVAAPAVLPEGHVTSPFMHPKPAAFPSLPTVTAPSPSPAQVILDFSGNGMKELVEALEKGNAETVIAILRHFDGLYATGTEEWYESLRRRWGEDESNTEVNTPCETWRSHQGVCVGCY